MATSGVRALPACVSHERGAAGHDFSDGLNDGGTNRTFRLFVKPAKPAVALLKDIGEAGKHNHFTEEVGAEVITVAAGHNKSQPSGCLLGMKARLPEKLDYLWRSCNGKLCDQNDLFRLTYAFELAKDAGWIYNLLADRAWTGRHAVKLNAGINGIYALRSGIDNGFDANGRVRYPLAVRITGNIEAVTELFAMCGWNIAPVTECTPRHDYILEPMCTTGV